MKSRLLLFSLSAAFLLCSAASAAPIGRPVTAEHAWNAGVVLSNQNTEVEMRAGAAQGEQQSKLWLGELAYGISQDAEIFLRAGGSYEKFDNGRLSMDLGDKFDWGVGLRGVMYNSWQYWRLLGDIQYLSRPGRRYISADVDIIEWQASASVEYLFRNTYYPYLGVHYRDLDLKSNAPTVFPTMTAARNWAIHGGCGWEPSERWRLFVEGQFGENFTASGGASYRF